MQGQRPLIGFFFPASLFPSGYITMYITPNISMRKDKGFFQSIPHIACSIPGFCGGCQSGVNLPSFRPSQLQLLKIVETRQKLSWSKKDMPD